MLDHINFDQYDAEANFLTEFFFPQIKAYEKIENKEERRKVAREIYDNFIMKELLSNSHVSTKISNVITPSASSSPLAVHF